MLYFFKEDFVGLLLEGYDAIGYYYNSLQDILAKDDVVMYKINRQLLQFQNQIMTKIICQYRDILNVYMDKLPSMDHANRLQYSTGKRRSGASIAGNAHTIFTIRLLQKWMNRIHNVIDVLQMKFN